MATIGWAVCGLSPAHHDGRTDMASGHVSMASIGYSVYHTILVDAMETCLG